MGFQTANSENGIRDTKKLQDHRDRGGIFTRQGNYIRFNVNELQVIIYERECVRGLLHFERYILSSRGIAPRLRRIPPNPGVNKRNFALFNIHSGRVNN